MSEELSLLTLLECAIAQRNIAKLADAYAAGVIDGEGCIRIAYRVRNGYEEWTLQVTLVNTCTDLVAALRATYGGSLHINRDYEEHPTRRTIWQWAISGPQAADMLNKIRPHLLVKAEQADIALQFQATMLTGSRFKGVSQETKELRRAMVRQITSAKGMK